MTTTTDTTTTAIPAEPLARVGMAIIMTDLERRPDSPLISLIDVHLDAGDPRKPLSVCQWEGESLDATLRRLGYVTCGGLLDLTGGSWVVDVAEAGTILGHQS